MENELGIRIEYNSEREFDKHTKYFDADFSIGFRKKNEKKNTFISNREIRNAIRKLGKITKGSVSLGDISFMVELGKRKATYISHYPLGRNPPKEFLGKGIAGYLELLALQEMKKRFPSVKKIRFNPFTGERTKQLKDRGIKFNQEYLFEEMIKKLQEKLRKDIRKARRKTVKHHAKKVLRWVGKTTGIRRLKRVY